VPGPDGWCLHRQRGAARAGGNGGACPHHHLHTSRAIDVATIPADPAQIDEAYVQAVVDTLFEVDAKATKIFVETN
jgi:hypothetical protein